ncbi:DUF72 domain-containing protein [Homoserinimonas sp. A447]
MSENESRSRVGTSGWDHRHWQGHFYPQSLPQRGRLGYASERLSTLEINTTFHGGGSPSSFLAWRDATPADFAFSVKGPKSITHGQALGNPARGVADFFASGVLGLREKLASVLWQFPPGLGFSPEVVEGFLALLPHSIAQAQRLIEQEGRAAIDPGASDTPIRHALEVRHASFDTPAFVDLLRRYDVAAVVTNSPTWPQLREVTADFAYLRLHSGKDHHPNGYDAASLDEWASLVDGWRSGAGCTDGSGRDTFVYFVNPEHNSIRPPFDAMALQGRLGGAGGNEPPLSVGQPSLW